MININCVQKINLMLRLVPCFSYIVTRPHISDDLSRCVSAHTWPRQSSIQALTKTSLPVLQRGTGQDRPHKERSVTN